MKSSLDKLSVALKYEFRDRSLLEKALTHSSMGKNNNERLEFLGDSILGWVIAEALFQRFPHAKEGELSRLRAGLVKGVTLAEIAREFKLGDYLRLGQGELKSGGHRRESTLADAVEAIIGAVFLDSDIETCKRQVLSWFGERIDKLSLKDDLKDSKTRLQEYLQARKQALPKYEITATYGKEHEQVFEVVCRVPMLQDPQTGVGSSRRQAEQNAAGKVLGVLEAEKKQNG